MTEDVRASITALRAYAGATALDYVSVPKDRLEVVCSALEAALPVLLKIGIRHYNGWVDCDECDAVRDLLLEWGMATTHGAELVATKGAES